MNTPNPMEYQYKLGRIREFLKANEYGACILSRRDNFAWLTCGGDNKVLRNTDTGFGVFLITKEEVYFIAQYMDYFRITDDEMQGLDIKGVFVRWYEKSSEEKAVELAKGLKCVSDSLTTGAECRTWDIFMLHYPLMEEEIWRYQKAAATCEKLIRDVADRIKPGMSEQQIEAEILYDYAKEGMTPKVCLVGSDERISKYRHPNASPKQVEKLVLLHPAADKWGLHVNITRMVYFGDTLPEELKNKYDLLNLCEAQAMAMTHTGMKMQDILDERKAILRKHGMKDEWKNHYPGALTGYMLGDAYPFLINMEIREGMSFEYFITVEGAKVEEVCISEAGSGRLISTAGHWPTKAYEWKGHTYELPVIYQR